MNNVSPLCRPSDKKLLWFQNSFLSPLLRKGILIFYELFVNIDSPLCRPGDKKLFHIIPNPGGSECVGNPQTNSINRGVAYGRVTSGAG